MSLRINHNIAAMNGHRMMLRNDQAVSESLERLSSGLRINKAADDAAGLVISEQMRAQIAGIGQAISNSETAISMVQTAEGALDEINTLLNKARELTLHAANAGTNDVNQLSADQAELDNIVESINRISQYTQFGTKKILDGSLNGATALTGGLNRVQVGNLANNPAIAPGTVNVVVTPGAQESVTLIGSLATDSYVFSGTVTGITLGTGTVNAGVSVVLSVGTGVVSLVTTGQVGATNLASSLNTLTQPLGFAVSADGAGNMVVTRSALGDTDFTTNLTFTRGPTSTLAGVNEKVTSSLQVTAPSTNSGAAAVIFSGITMLSGVSSSTVVNGGTNFNYVIDTATGGTFSGSVSVTTGTTSTMSAVLANLQSSIQAHATFTGATVSLDGGGASGTFMVGLTRETDAIATDFNFTLSVDYLNNPQTISQMNTIDLSSSTFSTGGVSVATFTTGVAGVSGVSAGSSLDGTSYLVSGNAINLVIEGQTLVFTGGQDLATLASSMQTAVNALGGDLASVRVVFATGGTNLSGFAGQQGVTGSLAGGFAGFVVYNTDGKDLSVSLAIDQKLGIDVNNNDTVLITGDEAGATLNLTTIFQDRTESVTAVTGHSGVTITSQSGSEIVSSGIDLTATMTTANGVILNLISTSLTASGAATLTLSTGSQDLGYLDFSTEIASGLETAGGVATFVLDNGAVFQVGANANQQVGVIIESVATTELGRNVVGAGSLLSLSDLHSSQQGALLNGLTTEAIHLIDATMNEITTLRGRLGAIQSNTLESGLSSLRAANENLTSAESTIRDVDFAEESANFTRNQILVQASTAMLAQANQLPQNVLKLLNA
jgi:flagellin